ncbi:MAG: D-alanyl-D-alanine carboxypeptidase/D-alanyl-D-alanine-endopeptidase [Acidobacteriota bacterium]
MPRTGRLVSVMALMACALIVSGSCRVERPPGAAPPGERGLESIVRELEQQMPGATVGVLVADATTGEELVSANADRLFVPASTQKLFTTAAALEELGGSYRFLTRAILAPNERGGSDLVLIGGGDPSIDGTAGACPEALFSQVALALARAGMHRIDGDVVGDDSRLGRDYHHPSWQLADLDQPYGAPVSALTFDDNSVAIRVQSISGQPPMVATPAPYDVTSTLQSSDHTQILYERSNPTGPLTLAGWIGTDRVEVRVVPIARPALHWAGELKRYLESAGIGVGGLARERLGDHPPSHGTTILEWPSPPLRDLILQVNQRSLNLWADLLYKTLGEEVVGDGTFAGGADAVALMVARAGIGASDVVLVDGSGLSRVNLVTPTALVKLLLHMRASPHATDFASSLPVAGRDGTLRMRFAGTPLEGRLLAKTGTLQWVSAIAGYIRISRELAFAVTVNGRLVSSAACSAAIDKALVRIAAAIEAKGERDKGKSMYAPSRSGESDL